MAKLFVLILSLACASLYAEEIYKEVDSDGVSSFSDRAVLGTEPVKIQKTSTFTDDSLQRQKDMQSPDTETKTKQVRYSARVTDPENGASIRDNSGALTLTIDITPDLSSGDKAELLMDGQKIRDLQASGTVALSNVDRGTHSFSIRVVNDHGKVIDTGPSTSISILRHAVPRPAHHGGA